MSSVTTRLLLACLTALAVLGGGGVAEARDRPAPLRAVDTSVRTTSRVLTDGERRLGVVAAGTLARPESVTVIDTTAAQPTRTWVAPLPGCQAASVTAGALLWTCPHTADTATDPYRRGATGVLIDLSGGATSTLPDLADRLFTNDDRLAWSALGSRWAQATVTGYHYEYELWVDRLTGAVLRSPSSEVEAATAIDLDDPALAVALCADVRRPMVPGPFIDVVPGPIAHVDGWWAGAGVDANGPGQLPRRALLERCGRPRLVLRREAPRLRFGDAVLGHGFVAWVEDSTDGDPLVGQRGGTSLVVRALDGRRVGRPRRLPLAASSTPIAVGARLYVLQADALLRVALG